MQSAPSPSEPNNAFGHDSAIQKRLPIRTRVYIARFLKQVAASIPRPVITLLSGLKARVRRIRATRAAQPLVSTLFGPDTSSATLAATGDVLVARVQQGTDQAIILKVASTESAAHQIDLEAKALVELDQLLIDVTGHLPVARVLDSGTSPQGAWFTQSMLPGEPTAELAPGNRERISMVADALGPLYAATQRRADCTPQVLHELIDRPIANITTWRPALRDQLNDIGTQLAESFGTKQLTLCRIHGDLGPTNVLWEADASAISGIVDWSFSSAQLLPEIDLAHLAITLLSHQRDEEYGRTVIQLCQGEIEDSSLEAMRTALDSGPNGLAIADAAVLTWLHHVSFGLERQEQLRANPLWLHHNVDAVVHALTANPRTELATRWSKSA